MSFDRWVEDRVETSRRELGGGHYIDLAKYITGAEQQYIAAAGFKGIQQDKSVLDGLMEPGESGPSGQTFVIDITRQKLARMHVYIKGWNATKADGSALKLDQSTLASLSVPAFNTIDEAIEAHIKEMAEGKALGAATGAPSPTSASGSEGGPTKSSATRPKN